MIKYVVDIDGTLCEDTQGKNYIDPEPNWALIARLNDEWRAGAHITIFTARGMNRFNGDVKKADEAFRELTVNWLQKNSVCYDELLFGKPAGDFYIDDKSIQPDDFVRH